MARRVFERYDLLLTPRSADGGIRCQTPPPMEMRASACLIPLAALVFTYP